MSPPCLEYQGCDLIPSVYWLLLFCLVLLLLLSSPFLLSAQSLAYIPEMYFLFLEIGLSV